MQNPNTAYQFQTHSHGGSIVRTLLKAFITMTALVAGACSFNQNESGLVEPEEPEFRTIIVASSVDTTATTEENLRYTQTRREEP